MLFFENVIVIVIMNLFIVIVIFWSSFYWVFLLRVKLYGQGSILWGYKEGLGKVWLVLEVKSRKVIVYSCRIIDGYFCI